jgi:hypothetical protein
MGPGNCKKKGERFSREQFNGVLADRENDVMSNIGQDVDSEVHGR